MSDAQTDPVGAPAPGAQMTVDELARTAGITTRNVRSYQSRGLLPAPRLEGRVAYYDVNHLARLHYIAELQQRGFSLAAINDLLAAWEEGRSIGDLLGLQEAVTAPWNTASPRRYTRERIEELFPEMVKEPALLERSVELGLLTRDGDGFTAANPGQIEAGAELVANGIPLAAVLHEHVELMASMNYVADRFIAQFTTHIWEPFAAAGFPPDQVARVTAAMQRLRPTVGVVVNAGLLTAMERAVAAATAAAVRAATEAAVRAAATPPPESAN